jgi:hypothetical protein
MSSRILRTSSRGFPRRVLEIPILVADPGEDGTYVSAPHRDHDVGVAHGLVAQELRPLSGEIDPDLGHDLDDRGVQTVGGLGAGRPDPDTAGGKPFEQGGGHLAPPGVVDAHEQDAGRDSLTEPGYALAQHRWRTVQEPYMNVRGRSRPSG